MNTTNIDACEICGCTENIGTAWSKKGKKELVICKNCADELRKCEDNQSGWDSTVLNKSFESNRQAAEEWDRQRKGANERLLERDKRAVRFLNLTNERKGE